MTERSELPATVEAQAHRARPKSRRHPPAQRAGSSAVGASAKERSVLLTLYAAPSTATGRRPRDRHLSDTWQSRLADG